MEVVRRQGATKQFLLLRRRRYNIWTLHEQEEKYIQKYNNSTRNYNAVACRVFRYPLLSLNHTIVPSYSYNNNNNNSYNNKYDPQIYTTRTIISNSYKALFSSITSSSTINETYHPSIERDGGGGGIKPTETQNDGDGDNNEITLLYDDYIKKQVQKGLLRDDKIQKRTAKVLQRLQKVLIGYDNIAFTQQIPLLSLDNTNNNKQENNDDGIEQTNEHHPNATPVQQQQLSPPMKLGIYDPSIGIPVVTKTNKFSNASGSVTQRKDNSIYSSSEDFSSKDVPINQQQQQQQLPRIPRGLYIYGSVGIGKSMLMDLFYKFVPVQKKGRYHFHEFMTLVHNRIHELKQYDLQSKGRDFHVNTTMEMNPIYRVAQQFSTEHAVLCFDEFQVTDIADAMIVAQFFDVLFRMGTVVVATSNRHPDDLYEHGLNRSYFLPFIPLLQHHCIIHEMDSKSDYRHLLSKTPVVSLSSSSSPLTNSKTQSKLDAIRNIVAEHDCMFITNDNTHQSSLIVSDIAKAVRQSLEETSIELPSGYRRTITMKKGDAQGLVARCTFDELCNRCLAASDYRAIANRFSIVCIEQIPLLRLTGGSTDNHDKARRFITLIDELYEKKVALICTSSSSGVPTPSDIFIDDSILNNTSTVTNSYNDNDIELGIDEAISCGIPVGALASVRELSFAFRRAASRITEMTSYQWWFHKSKLAAM